MTQMQTDLLDRDYEAPAVVVLGDFRELTRGTGGSGFDVDANNACTPGGTQPASDCGNL